MTTTNFSNIQMATATVKTVLNFTFNLTVPVQCDGYKAGQRAEVVRVDVEVTVSGDDSQGEAQMEIELYPMGWAIRSDGKRDGRQQRIEAFYGTDELRDEINGLVVVELSGWAAAKRVGA